LSITYSIFIRVKNCRIWGSHGGEYEDGCLLNALMMEAARTSETMINFYQTTQCYNPEDSRLQSKKCFKQGLSLYLSIMSWKKLYILLLTIYTQHVL
jgi:hypothetical protein